MKPSPLAYHRPASVEEAVDLLGGADLEAKVLAGGQSLVPMLNLRMVAADKLIDITGIPNLCSWSEGSGELRIGSCVTHEAIQAGRLPEASNGLMAYVASRIAYQAVRNRGTIGGSLALADPSADWLATTAALGATVEWQGPAGPASCPAEEFVLAAYTTRLEPLDVLTGIRVPRLDPEARWGAYKICRKAGEFAHAMAIAILSPGRSRAFLGATDGAPIRLRHAEEVLGALQAWQPSHAKALRQAFDADVSAAGRPLTDVQVWQSHTCLLRAVQMSFGIEEIRIENA